MSDETTSSLRQELKHQPEPDRRLMGKTIYEVSREWRVLLDRRLKPWGLSSARWITLFAIDGAEDGACQKRIAEDMGVECPTLVRLLDGLEKDGWVRRRACETDRRIRLAELTPKAEQFLDRAVEIAVSLSKEITGDIPEEELALCHDVLLRIQDRIGKLE